MDQLHKSERISVESKEQPFQRKKSKSQFQIGLFPNWIGHHGTKTPMEKSIFELICLT